MHALRTLTDPEHIKNYLNWKSISRVQELGSCLFIPYHDAHGRRIDYCRLKPTHPPINTKGKASKYLGPKGKPVQVYFPVISRPAYHDSSTPLAITEGEKKALCASILGFTVIGLGGVSCWSNPRKKDSNGKRIGNRELHPALAELPWKQRQVYIVFDSDRTTNHAVQREEYQLATALKAQGAIVKIVQIPPEEEGRKQGIDDYLVAQGAEAFKQLLTQAVSPSKPDSITKQLTNFMRKEITSEDGSKKTIVTGLSVNQLQQRLFSLSGGYPKRVGKQLFVRHKNEVLYLDNTDHLMAWAASILPGHQNSVIWRQGQGMVTPSQYFASFQQQAEPFDAVANFPHEPALPRHYYCHPAITHSNTRLLFEFLGKFNPASEVDAHLLLALLLTLVSGLAPGQRPAFLITAQDDDEEQGRGVGKTTLVRMAAQLFGGLIEYSQEESASAFKTRLLSPCAREMRVILLDNIKSHHFSQAGLEAMITSSTISGKQNYVGEGQLPNTFTWCLTINGAHLSKDMAKRCIVIKLARPENSGTWESDTQQFIEVHRWEIIGGLITMLKRPPLRLEKFSRWGEWEKLVLSCLSAPQECQRVIHERQLGIDDDEEEKLLVQDGIQEFLKEQGLDPLKHSAFISSLRMAEVVNRVTGMKRPTNRVSSYLSQLNIPELRKSDRGTARGWMYVPAGSNPDRVVHQLK
ncbi:MAG: DUF3854 domain-containing protein [Planctomycetia bacterium]|nr:DUF3854 domain-containing protein [Planctomycetia bacterium]